MQHFTTRRIVLDAVLIALYFALSLLSIEFIGIKITFAMLPILLAALLFGPVDGLLVGLLGAFLEQLIKYGFTPTTPLWMLPEALRGLLYGLFCYRLCKMQLTKKRLFFFFGSCIVVGLLTSCANTAVYYVDAKLYGYYTYGLIFGVFFYRLALSVLVSVLSATLAQPIITALKRTGILQRGTKK